ncbi:MAG TPA: CARDB domain-containing protein, partial [Anaerolineales bacterium]|nr:CARDB domain-containing protein [Anaerolineales bacterium]
QMSATQPSGNEPVSADTGQVGTAVALTAAAQLTGLAGSATSTSAASPTLTDAPTLTFTPTSSIPTQCNPLVTATVNANVRSGPDTAYDIVGALTLGQTATIVGRNDAYTWWYIAYPGISGGHAWIAGTVVTSACVPSVVQVVAAPPLPTPTTVPVVEAPSDDEDNSSLLVVPEVQLAIKKPDLIVSEFTITPATPVMGQNAHVRIGVYNQGNAVSGPYTVVWYGLSSFASPSCSWSVDKSNAGGGRILQCDFVFNSWYPINKASVAIVDANNQVSESNEGNNQGTITPFGVTDH